MFDFTEQYGTIIIVVLMKKTDKTLVEFFLFSLGAIGTCSTSSNLFTNLNPYRLCHYPLYKLVF